MNRYQILKFTAHARTVKHVYQQTGFMPSNADIMQKIHHILRGTKATYGEQFRQDVMAAMKRIYIQCAPSFKHGVIQHEIDKIKKNPSKPLPLP